MKVVDVFKAFGDNTRLRIIYILRQEELCVCEIEVILGITQSNASRHLNKLKTVGIIDYEKKSQWVHYFIAPEFIKTNKTLLEYLDNHIRTNDKLIKDSSRLKKYKESGISCDHIKDSAGILDD